MNTQSSTANGDKAASQSNTDRREDDQRWSITTSTGWRKRLVMISAIAALMGFRPASYGDPPAWLLCHSDRTSCVGTLTNLLGGGTLSYTMSGTSSFALVDAFTNAETARNVIWTNILMQGTIGTNSTFTATLDPSRTSTGTVVSVGSVEFPAAATMSFFFRLNSDGIFYISDNPAVLQGTVTALPPAPGDTLSLVSGPVVFHAEGVPSQTNFALTFSTVAFWASYTNVAPVGYSYLCNQLDHFNNLANVVIPNTGSYDGDQLLLWNCSSFQTYTFDSTSSTGFSDAGGVPIAAPSLPPGQGFQFNNISGAPQTVVFTGTPHVPVLPAVLPCGCGQLNLLGRQTSATGNYTNITGLSPNDGSQEQIWNGSGLSVYDFTNGAWSPGTPPDLGVGQSAFFQAPCGSNCLSMICVPDRIVSCNSNGSCSNSWAFNAPSATSACCTSAVTISIIATVTNGTGCSQTYTRTWLATDCLGNSATCSQTVALTNVPMITVQPVPVTVPVSNNAIFAVIASGTAPLSYQWYLNDVTPLIASSNYVGTTSPVLTISNVEPADAGSVYSVTVNNAFGSVRSIDVPLTVQPLLTYTVNIQSGRNLIANQLDQGGNKLSEVLGTNCPKGCAVFKFDNVSRAWSGSAYSATNGWVPDDFTLSPGEGAYLYSPSSFALTFSGTPHIPVLPISFASFGGNCALLSRQTNDLGTWDNIIGTPPTGGEQVYKFSGGGFSSYVFDEFSLTWTPTTPVAAVGEAMWLCPSNGSGLSSPGPLIAKVPDQFVNKGGCSESIAFLVASSSASASSITVSAASDNSTLVPGSNIVLGGSGANRTITITPDTNYTGKAVISLIANGGAQSATNSFALTVLPSSTVPLGTGFEQSEGYFLGDLNSQDGWLVDAGSASVWTNVVHSGSQAAMIAPGGAVSRTVGSGAPVVAFSCYIQAVPSAAPALPVSANAALLYLDPVSGLNCLDGDGNGGGSWVASGFSPAAGTWFQLTLELDFSAKTYTCSVNGTTSATTFHFQSTNVTALGFMAATAATNGATLLDDASVANTYPLPQLSLTLLGSSVRLSWPAGLAQYRLQATTNLPNDVWVTLPATNDTFTDPLSQQARFYRLISP
jgi:Immunoglobulin I-set domain